MNIVYVCEDNPLFERKIENATRGLKPACKKILQRISKKNAVIITDYITSMQTEINPSDHYKKAIIMLQKKEDTYNETLEEQKKKEDGLAVMEDKFDAMQSQIQSLILLL
jgi:hypothetical protein